MNSMMREPRPMKLSNATLAALPESVRRPTYDRAGLTPGILHIGLGNFHRAHQAWYLHRLMQMGFAHDWAIVGAGVRPVDGEQRQKMLAQDCLTTLIELDPAGMNVEVTGSMIDYVPVEEGNAALIARMAEPGIRIVSTTVTEGGYYLDPAEKTFDARHPDILHDAANPERPRTAFGAMVAALRLRRDQGVGPFTGQSCDNLQGNGDVLRQTVVGLARLSDPDLANWIDQNCTFPNSMVDCIVPATGPKELALAREIGIDDAVPVTHENFRQWVIEDDFCAGRPPFEKVGVTFSDNVHAYETMKLRLLNACHSAIAEAAQVLGVDTIAGCMSHNLISAFVRRLATQEIAPTVKAVPEFAPLDYAELIMRRFSNPKIVDTTRRVAADGSSKHPGFILPILKEQLATGGAIEGLALVEAAWARMSAGVREDGSKIDINDPNRADLVTAANAARTRPRAWLEQSQFYGDLSRESRFADAFEGWLSLIWAEGISIALAKYTT